MAHSLPNIRTVKTTSDRLLLYHLQFLAPSVYAYVSSSGTGSRSATSGELFSPSPAALHAIFSLGAGERASFPPLHPSSSSTSTKSADEASTSSSSAAAGADAASSSGSSNVSSTCEILFQLVLNIDAGLAACSAASDDYLLVTTRRPPAVQAMPWPLPPHHQHHHQQQRGPADSSGAQPVPQERRTRTARLDKLEWLQLSADPVPSSPPSPPSEALAASAAPGESASSSERSTEGAAAAVPPADGAQEASPRSTRRYIAHVEHSRAMDMYVWITDDGRAHVARLHAEARQPADLWRGRTFHGVPKLAKPTRRRSSAAATAAAAAAQQQGQQRKGSGSNDRPEMAAIDAADASIVTDANGDASAYVVDPEANNNRASKTHLPLDAEVPLERRAVTSAINARFSLIAIGQADGSVTLYSYRTAERAPPRSHTFHIRHSYKSTASYLTTGPVTSLAWTSDGHALAVAWHSGWAVWSTYGKLMACSMRESWQGMHKKFMDTFLFGAERLFWSPGNTELFFLTRRKKVDESTSPRAPELDADNQLFVLPFAKSAIASQHSPENARYAFVQLDDSVLVYRGSDQPDISIINPESDIWQHIQIPQAYLAYNWPIRYASISSDGKLIAVAGRRGLAHYSIASGRWKTYANSAQEQAFAIRGGLQWFHHVLVAACDCGGGTYQLRMYSRDLDLDNSQLLYIETLASPVLLTSLFEDSLLVYTADNTFYHYLITTSATHIGLKLCGSITFDGVVGEPGRVRGMSWMVPPSQQEFGDPIDDLTVAAIIFLIDGKLVLLRPRRLTSDEEEVSYDMQILADQIEFYWTHLQGIGALENSLWGYDGQAIRIWLNALSLEADRGRAIANADSSTEGEEDDDDRDYKTIEESVSLPLDFYPLAVLMEKGIIIGADPETSLRKSLDFVTFRNSTNVSGISPRIFVNCVLMTSARRPNFSCSRSSDTWSRSGTCATPSPLPHTMPSSSTLRTRSRCFCTTCWKMRQTRSKLAGKKPNLHQSSSAYPTKRPTARRSCCLLLSSSWTTLTMLSASWSTARARRS